MNHKGRPMTPMLDAVQQEATQLAQWESEEQARRALAEQERQRAEAVRKERQRLARVQRERCEQAARDAELAATQLSAALDRYIAAAPVPAYQLKPRIQSFINLHVGRFGPLQSNGVPDLCHELFREAP